MKESKKDASNILENRSAIARSMASGFGARELDMGRPYEMDMPRFEELAEYDVTYLSYALDTGEPGLFTGYVRWLHSMLSGHGLPGEYIVPMALDNLLRAVRETVALEDPDEVARLIESGKTVRGGEAAHPDTFLKPGNPLSGLATDYLDCIVKSDRRGALNLIQGAVAGNVPIRDIYLNIFEPVQREIGRLWQMQKISVAHEHFASSTTQMAMSMLYRSIFEAEDGRTGCSMVAACVGKELHEIGLRMVADLFELSGWETVFLGANSPMHAIAAMLRETRADLLALSCSMIVHVEHIRATIAYLRREGFADLPVIVGGFPFNLSPKLSGLVGADGYAPDAGAAIQLGNGYCLRS
jgi:methanogenic corrinoid protein MtbC1